MLGFLCVAGCAQLPWLQGDPVPASPDSPQTLPYPQQVQVFTTAIEPTAAVDDSTVKKDASPYPLIAPAAKSEIKLTLPPGAQPASSAAPQVPPPALSTMPPGPTMQTPMPTLSTGPPANPVSYPQPLPLPGQPVPQIQVHAGPSEGSRESGIGSRESGIGSRESGIGTTAVSPPYAPLPTPYSRPPVIDALIALMEGRPNDYRANLDKYPPATREIIGKFLAVIYRLDQRKDVSPGGSLLEMDDIIRSLQPRTELAIDTVCFCEWAKAFGNYQPLPENPLFQAGASPQQRDRVQLYVEVRNFETNKKDGFYETRLVSSVEIREKDNNNMVWAHNFEEKDHVIRSRSLLHDYFNNYSFRLPSLPHGNYTLIIRIVDQTHGQPGREKSKSIAFRVGSSQR
jgi:hypothetical protein